MKTTHNLNPREAEAHQAAVRKRQEELLRGYRTRLDEWQQQLPDLQTAGAALPPPERGAFDSRYESLRSELQQAQAEFAALAESKADEEDGRALDAVRHRAEQAWHRVKDAGEALKASLPGPSGR